MPDIAMCTGEQCPKKQMCYRHTAKASDYQSYFMTPPIKEDGTCEYYWDNIDYPPEGAFHIKLNNNDTTERLPEKDSKRRGWHY
jgi:hypothetical protein